MKKHPSKPADKRRILIADDHPLFREGLVQLINRERDLSCCGETGTVAATRCRTRRAMARGCRSAGPHRSHTSLKRIMPSGIGS